MADRKARGRTQRLYLIERMPSKAKYKQSFQVMGSTGNVYMVEIKATPSCTCPDYMTRKRRCKHIYFIMLRIMGIVKGEDKAKYTRLELETMFASVPQIRQDLCVSNTLKDKYAKFKTKEGKEEGEKGVAKRLDDSCPICLEEFDDTEPVDYCKATCGKAVHVSCFDLYAKTQARPACVFCRSPWKGLGEGLGDGTFAYLNLAT